MSDAATLELRHADSSVELRPTLGGAVARFRWRGRDILRPAPAALPVDAAAAVRQMACYALVPYSNRIGAALLRSGGRGEALRPNFQPEPHSIHGFGWQRPWRLQAHSGSTAELLLEHRADADWPFDCVARQSLSLDDDGLHLMLSVRNGASRSMPAGLGWHPYFPLIPEVRLQTDWRGAWPVAASGLPEGLAPLPQSSPFRRSRALDGWRVDQCFSGWSGLARLDYPGYHVLLQADATCGYLVCFAPDDGRGFIALEPASHANNAFALAAQGVAGTGMRLLAPGEEMHIDVTIAVRSDD